MNKKLPDNGGTNSIGGKENTAMKTDVNKNENDLGEKTDLIVKKVWKKKVRKSNVSIMASIADDIDNLILNTNFVDLHGRDLHVLEDENGDFFVPLKEIRQTGFAIFRKENYNESFKNQKTVKKEFELHMLAEARNYLLKHKITFIKEQDILDTIQKCENILLGSSNNSNPRRSITTINNSIQITSNLQDTVFPKQTDNGLKRMGNLENGSPKLPNTSPNNYQNKKYNNKDSNKLNNSFSSNNSGETKKAFVPINPVKLELNKPLKVQISFVEKEKIAWLQLVENSQIQKDLIFKTFELSSKAPIVKNPEIGQLYIAEFEEGWYRVQLRGLNPLHVMFIDYGNRSEVTSVKEISEELKNIPAQAVRAGFSDNNTLKENMTLTIIAKKQYDDGTYSVSSQFNNSRNSNGGKYQQAISSVPNLRKPNNYTNENRQQKSPMQLSLTEKNNKPVLQESVPKKQETVPKKQEILPKKQEVVAKKQEDAYYKVVKSNLKLEPGQQVLILGYEDDTLLLRSNNSFKQFVEIASYIQTYKDTAKNLTSFKVGQIILCNKDESEDLFRAQITAHECSMLSVKYIDIVGEDAISPKSNHIKNVDSTLANFPSAIISSPVMKDLKKYTSNSKCFELIEELMQTKTKLTVVISGDNFDLKLPKEELLTKKLETLLNPEKTEKVPEKKPVESKPKASKSNVTFDDMGYLELKLGVGEYMCYSFQSIEQLTVLSLEESETRLIEEITSLEVIDTEEFVPNAIDMCLATFKGPDEQEASWYRGVVLDGNKDNFDILFVDYGNTETLTSKDLRRFPENLKNIPILGITCELTGIPKTTKIEERLKEIIPDGETFSIDVKCKSGEVYKIEIPAVYEILRKEGLL